MPRRPDVRNCETVEYPIGGHNVFRTLVDIVAPLKKTLEEALGESQGCPGGQMCRIARLSNSPGGDRMSNRHKRHVDPLKEDPRGCVQEAKCAELRDCRIVQGGSGCLTGIREMLAPLKKTLEGVSRRPDVQNCLSRLRGLRLEV